MLTYSCEKADLQKSSKEGTILTPRTDDCENCPIDDCCCVVQLNASSSANIDLCGTDSGIGLCQQNNPPGPCSAISNGGTHFNLSTTVPYGVFCMVKGNSFYVHNNSGGTVSLKVSCQHDQVGPQFINFTLAAGGYAYFVSDSECGLTQCI